MIAPFVARGLVVRRRPAKGGRGVFAIRSFAQGELLVIWGGVAASGAELDRLSAQERVYALQVDDDLHLVTPIGEIDVGTTSIILLAECRPVRRGQPGGVENDTAR